MPDAGDEHEHEQHGRDARGTARCTGASCGSRCATRPRSPTTPSPVQSSWRSKNHHAVPLLSSDCTDDAESTITTPMTLSTATTMSEQQVGRRALRARPCVHTRRTPARRSAGHPEPPGSRLAVVLTHAGSRLGDEARTSLLEVVTALLVALVPVERRARRREQHGVAGRGEVGGGVDRGPHRVGTDRRARDHRAPRSTSSGVSPIATTARRCSLRRGERRRGRRPCCRRRRAARPARTRRARSAWRGGSSPSSRRSTPPRKPYRPTPLGGGASRNPPAPRRIAAGVAPSATRGRGGRERVGEVVRRRAQRGDLDDRASPTPSA